MESSLAVQVPGGVGVGSASLDRTDSELWKYRMNELQEAVNLGGKHA
jgi:hypothetical protein